MKEAKALTSPRAPLTFFRTGAPVKTCVEGFGEVPPKRRRITVACFIAKNAAKGILKVDALLGNSTVLVVKKATSVDPSACNFDV